jgi:hypothetical protein
MILPVLLLVIGLVGGLLVIWKKRKCRSAACSAKTKPAE